MHQMNAGEEIHDVSQQPKKDVVLEQFEKIDGYVQNVLIFTKDVFELAAVVTKKEEDWRKQNVGKIEKFCLKSN